MFNPAGRKRRLIFQLLSILLCCQLHAQTRGMPPKEDSRAQPPELAANDLQKFLDDRIPARLENSNIAGAVVIVVKNGEILLSKGYGFADVKTRRPMSPEDTLIRPGSITKLFTWTAVMQQVELGKLDLDRDINDYLDFKIPEAFGRPITLRNIMTHTAGFEETLRQLITYNPARLISLESYVKGHIPARIYPPGEVTAYSNYATALAGYIVERVSRQSFADYVSNHILAPLEMTHSTFAQPLPDALQARMGSGYTVASQAAQPYELTNNSPSGALATTGADLAHFMIAHLQKGRFGKISILKPATAQLMRQHQRSEADGFGGFALGFMDQVYNGHDIIGHSGSTQFWNSELRLIPDANVGFFVTTNSAGRLGYNVSLLSGLFQEFLDRYFGAGAPIEATAPTAVNDAKRVAGRYVSSRRPESSFFRLLNLLTSPIVTANSDATIEVNLLRGGPDFAPIRWREVGQLVYREADGRRRLAFVPDSSGRISHMAVDGDPMLIYQRAPETEAWVGRFIGISLMVFVIALISWPIAFFIRSHHPAIRIDLAAPKGRWVRWTWLISRLGCFLWLITFAGWAYMIFGAALDLTLLSEPIATRLYLLYGLTVVSLAGSVLAVANALLAWRNPASTLLGKVADSVVALAAVYVSWIAITFHLASFKMTF